MVYGALVLVQLVLSGWNVLASLIINNEVNPLIFTCYRELIALFFLYATAILLDGGFQTPAREHMGTLALLGLLNYINILGYTLGLTYTSPETLAVYQCSIPLFTGFLGILLKQEKLDKIKVSGILVAALGALVAAAFAKTESGDLGTKAVLGNVLLLAESISISIFLVIQRPLLHYYPHTWVVAWGYTGAVILCLLSLLYFVEHPSNWSIKGVEREIALVYAAVIASGLVQNLMAWGNMITRSTIVAIFTTMQPMFNAVIYYGPGHKFYKLTLPVIIGSIISLLGIVLTCWRDKILHSSDNEPEDPIYNDYNYKTSSYEPRNSESCISQSTQTIQSVHYHTPADRIGLVGTGYTPINSDGRDRLQAPTDLLRCSRATSNESLTHGFRKATRCSFSTSTNANQYIAL